MNGYIKANQMSLFCSVSIKGTITTFWR